MSERHYTPTRDTFIRGAPTSQNDTNFGTNQLLSTEVVTFGGAKTLWSRTLLDFDVSDLAGAGTITAAQLELEVNFVRTPTAGAKLYRVKRENKPWTELGATWNKYDGASSWATAGCEGAADKDTTTPTPKAFTTPAATGQFTITGLLAFVTDAINNRSSILSLIAHLDDESDQGASRGFTWLAREAATPTLLRVTLAEPPNPARRPAHEPRDAHRQRPTAHTPAARPARPHQPLGAPA